MFTRILLVDYEAMRHTPLSNKRVLTFLDIIFTLLSKLELP